MPTSYSLSQPLTHLLYRDENVIVTNSRIEIKEVSCATKYVSSIKLHEEAPSRTHGWTCIAMSVAASLALLIYLYLGKISIGIYILAFLTIAIFAAAVTWKLLVVPPKYRIEFSLINGQTFDIAHSSELQIRTLHSAIKEAVAQNHQDAMPTDRFTVPVESGLPRRLGVESV